VTGYVVEPDRHGHRTLVVTGRWSPAIERALHDEQIDGLVLNAARGFVSAGDLGFLDPGIGLRRLALLDRSVRDLRPVERLGHRLEELAVTAHPTATVDLGALPGLRALFGPWAPLATTVGALEHLNELGTSNLAGEDLGALARQRHLRWLTVKDSRRLRSLDGLHPAAPLASLTVRLAPKLNDVSALAVFASTLRELALDACRRLGALAPLAALERLQHLELGDCGDIVSLAPLASLDELRSVYAWGTTRILDDDLSPLTRLPALEELRMRARRSYRPSVQEIQAGLPPAAT
jgi:hypothetical protein